MKKRSKFGIMTLMFFILSIANVSAIENGDFYVWYVKMDYEQTGEESVSLDHLMKVQITDKDLPNGIWSAYDREVEKAVGESDLSYDQMDYTGFLANASFLDELKNQYGAEEDTVKAAGKEWDALVVHESDEAGTAKTVYSIDGILLELQIDIDVKQGFTSLKWDMSVTLESLVDEDLAIFSPASSIPGYPFMIFALLSVTSIILLSKKIRK